MSASPDAPRTVNPDMSANHQEAAHPPHEHPSNVRHTPIFVESRDEPVINKNVDHGAHYTESKPHPPPPRADQYFADDGPQILSIQTDALNLMTEVENFQGTKKDEKYLFLDEMLTRNLLKLDKIKTEGKENIRQARREVIIYIEKCFAVLEAKADNNTTKAAQAQAQGINVKEISDSAMEPALATRQKAYPQNAFTRGPSPQRAQSPHPQPREQTLPPKPQPTSNNPITQILSIQTDALNLMTEVENFQGTKKDEGYLVLDEMLTRYLIKLDDIETEGKENIRQARREVIIYIDKCIAVLEAKADSNTTKSAQAQARGINVKEISDSAMEPALVMKNGEIEIKEQEKGYEPMEVD